MYNFTEHYSEAVKEQCLGIIAEIDVFPVSDEMLWVTGQTGRRQVGCSRVVGVVGLQKQTSDRRQ